MAKTMIMYIRSLIVHEYKNFVQCVDTKGYNASKIRTRLDLPRLWRVSLTKVRHAAQSGEGRDPLRVISHSTRCASYNSDRGHKITLGPPCYGVLSGLQNASLGIPDVLRRRP